MFLFLSLLPLALVLALVLAWFELAALVVYADMKRWLWMTCEYEMPAADSGWRTLSRNPVVILLGPGPEPGPDSDSDFGSDLDSDSDVEVSTEA